MAGYRRSGRAGNRNPACGVESRGFLGAPMSPTASDPDVHANQALDKALGSGALLDSLPVGICCCDHQGVIRRFNRRAAELWGCSPEIGDLNQRFNGAFRLFQVDGNPLPHAESPMARVLRTGLAARDQRLAIERPDGVRLIVLANV